MEPLTRYVTITRDISIREKYSGESKVRAALARVGARNITPMTLIVPAINDPRAEIPRAGPARPFLAIW